MTVEYLDPTPVRLALGLSKEAAALAAHVATSTWANWEAAGRVTPAYEPRIRRLLLKELDRKIQVLQVHAERLRSSP